jgi:hypothetical protein
LDRKFHPRRKKTLLIKKKMPRRDTRFRHHRFTDPELGPNVSVNPLLQWQFEKFASRRSRFWTPQEFVRNGTRNKHGEVLTFSHTVHDKLYADIEVFVHRPSNNINYRFPINPHDEHWIERLSIRVAKKFHVPHCKLVFKRDHSSCPVASDWRLFTHERPPILDIVVCQNAPIISLPDELPAFSPTHTSHQASGDLDFNTLKCRFKRAFTASFFGRLVSSIHHARSAPDPKPRSHIIRKTPLPARVFHQTVHDNTLYNQINSLDVNSFWAMSGEHSPTALIHTTCNHVVHRLRSLPPVTLDSYSSERDADFIKYLTDKLGQIDFFAHVPTSEFASLHHTLDFDYSNSEPDDASILSAYPPAHRSVATIRPAEEYRAAPSSHHAKVHNLTCLMSPSVRANITKNLVQSFITDHAAHLKSVTPVQSIIIAPVGDNHGITSHTIENLYTTNVSASNCVPFLDQGETRVITMRSGAQFTLSSEHITNNSTKKSFPIAEMFAHTDNENAIIIAVRGNPLV